MHMVNVDFDSRLLLLMDVVVERQSLYISFSLESVHFLVEYIGLGLAFGCQHGFHAISVAVVN